MSFPVGCGIWLKGFFADRSECSYPRPFFVIGDTGSTVKALNVSSVRGKLHKLQFPSNKRLTAYSPPFYEPSFVKLDVLYEFEKCPELRNSLMCTGKTANGMVVSSVLNWFSEYRSKSKVHKVSISRSDLIIRNPNLTIPSVLP